jgi:hypothetical protein
VCSAEAWLDDARDNEPIACACSISSPASAVTRSACTGPATRPSRSARATPGAVSAWPRTSPECRSMTTFAPSRRRADVCFGGPPCQQPALPLQFTATEQELPWPDMLRCGLDAGAEWFVVEQPPGNAAWEAEVADDLCRTGRHVAVFEFGAHDVGAPYLRRRVTWLPAPACRDWRSPGLRSHKRLSAPRGQQLPEVIGTRIPSPLSEWMLGVPKGFTSAASA